MEIQELQREFKYNSVKLVDPNPAFTLVQVRDFFANVYPEIISADIEGPEMVGNKHVYAFRPVGAPARPPVATMVRDLADLERIGWFHSEGRTATFIRITAEFVADNPHFLLSERHQARISALHAAHCSRTKGATV